MNPSRDCPACGLISPPGASRCDCGHELASGAEATPGRKSPGWMFWLLIGLVFPARFLLDLSGWAAWMVPVGLLAVIMAIGLVRERKRTR